MVFALGVEWLGDYSQATWFVLIIARCIARLSYTCRLRSARYINTPASSANSPGRLVGIVLVRPTSVRDRFPDIRFELLESHTITPLSLSLIGPEQRRGLLDPEVNVVFVIVEKEEPAHTHTHSLILTTPVGGRRRYSELNERESENTTEVVMKTHVTLNSITWMKRCCCWIRRHKNLKNTKKSRDKEKKKSLTWWDQLKTFNDDSNPTMGESRFLRVWPHRLESKVNSSTRAHTFTSSPFTTHTGRLKSSVLKSKKKSSSHDVTRKILKHFRPYGGVNNNWPVLLFAPAHADKKCLVSLSFMTPTPLFKH